MHSTRIMGAVAATAALAALAACGSADRTRTTPRQTVAQDVRTGEPRVYDERRQMRDERTGRVVEEQRTVREYDERTGQPIATSGGMSSGISGGCTLVLRNPAMRTEATFAPIQVRVFDNPAWQGYQSMPPRQAGLDPGGRASARAEGGTIGGTEQTADSAQQLGSPPELRSGHPTSSGAARDTMRDDRVTREDAMTQTERSRLYGEDARIADRRGQLLWSGWLKPNDRIDLPAQGPIRYDYRFAVDDRFHDEKTAWCTGNRQIGVPG